MGVWGVSFFKETYDPTFEKIKNLGRQREGELDSRLFLKSLTLKST